MSRYFDGKNNNFMEPRVQDSNGHMIMSNVHQPQKKKYINIDTRYQNQYGDAKSCDKFADYTYTLPQSITNVLSVCVKSLELSKVDSFSLQRKNTYFVIDGIAQPIRIEDGVYTAYSLEATLMSSLSSSDLTISFTGTRYSFVNNGANPVNVNFAVNSDGEPDSNYLKAKLGWVLGFRRPTYEVAPGATLTAEGYPTIHNMKYMFLSVDDFQNTAPVSFIAPSSQSFFDPNIIARVTIPSPEEDIVSSEAGGNLISDVREYSGKSDLQRLRIQLLDEFGNKVNTNKTDFSFVMEITYK